MLRVPSRHRINQSPGGCTVTPTLKAPLRQLQIVTRRGDRPTSHICLINQADKCRFGGRVYPCWDRATQSHGPFPSAIINLTAISAIALVKRSIGDERGDEDGVLQPVVPSPVLVRGVERAPGAVVDWYQTSLGSQAGAAGEPVGVTDLGEGSGARPGPEPTKGHQDLPERVRKECFFDDLGKLGSGGLDPFQVKPWVRLPGIKGWVARKVRFNRWLEVSGTLRILAILHR